MTPADASARQVWDAEAYARHARFVSDLAGPVLEWLAPRAGSGFSISAAAMGC